jgi:hypothetical protein
MADTAGVVHGLQVLYPDTEWPAFPFTHLRLWDCFTYWRDLHVAPGVFDFSRLDWVIEHARARGVTNITYTFGMTPAWAASNPNSTNHAPWLNPGCNSAPVDMGHWDAFVAAMVTRYAGRIGSWQIWNEPQLKWFWDGSMTVLAEMTRRATRIIGDIDDRAKIIAAPVLPTLGDCGETYLRALKAVGWPVDIWTAHVYPPAGATAVQWGNAIREWKWTLRDLKAPRKPLWVTETNANHGHGPIPTARVPKWMDAVDRQALELGVARVYWYAYGSHSDTSLLGIPLTAGTPGSRWIARHQ